MGKRIAALLTGLLVLFWGIVPARAAGPEVAAPSYVLMDAATGTVILEENAHEHLAPASVTKVMTLLLVMEALDSGRIGWDDSVTASAAAAAKGGSQIYLEEGESLPLKEMLKSVVVSSANDCAAALAEHVAGSEAAFVEKMNRRAEELDMADTRFANCTGLDDEAPASEHYSCAMDIAVMSRELLRHDEIRDYTTIWMDTVRNGQFGLSNTNKLIRFYKGATGLKTGYTSAAGHCLAASAKRDEMELIAVVLHCASSSDRFESAKALLDYGFANYALVDALPEEGLGSVPVRLGDVTKIEPAAEDPGPLLLEKDQIGDVERSVQLLPDVTAPVAAGQRLGLLTVRSGGAVVAEIPLVAAESVARQSYLAILRRVLAAACLGASEQA